MVRLAGRWVRDARNTVVNGRQRLTGFQDEPASKPDQLHAREARKIGRLHCARVVNLGRRLLVKAGHALTHIHSPDRSPWSTSAVIGCPRTSHLRTRSARSLNLVEHGGGEIQEDSL